MDECSGGELCDERPDVRLLAGILLSHQVSLQGAVWNTEVPDKGLCNTRTLTVGVSSGSDMLHDILVRNLYADEQIPSTSSQA